jgi:hypothetical protein
MHVLFLFFVEPDFGCGFSVAIHSFGGFVCALVAKLLLWCPCCVFWIIRHCSLYACVHNWKSRNTVPEEVKLMLSDSLSVKDEDKKGNWFSLMNL